MSCNFLFDPTHFLIFAKELKENENVFNQNCDCKVQHCLYRTIISRAYYSAFLLAQNQVENKYGKKKLKEKSEVIGPHNAVLELLNNFNPPAETFLSGLKERRKSADYKMDSLIDENEVDKAIETAQEIIDLLN